MKVIHTLNDDEIERSLQTLNAGAASHTAYDPAYLKQQTSWSLLDGKLCKHYTFTNFETAFSYMTKVALLAEEHDHHPEWFNVYSKLEVALVTHDAGGITEKDFALARDMDEILRAYPI